MSNTAEIVNINKGERKMPSPNGYVNLWRDLKRQPFYSDIIARGIFVDMLLTATHQPRIIDYSGVKVALNGGELIIKRKQFLTDNCNDSKVTRTLKKFVDLGVITIEVIKQNGRNIGQKVTFLNWQKWQKSEQPTEQPTEQPEGLNLKVLQGGIEQPTEQPTEQLINNNVLNNIIKDSFSTNHACQEVENQDNEIRNKIEKAFDIFWQEWNDSRKKLTTKNRPPKAKAKASFKKHFTVKKVKSKGIEWLEVQLGSMVNLFDTAFTDLANSKIHNTRSEYFNYESIQPPRFISNQAWDGADD